MEIKRMGGKDIKIKNKWIKNDMNEAFKELYFFIVIHFNNSLGMKIIRMKKSDDDFVIINKIITKLLIYLDL